MTTKFRLSEVDTKVCTKWVLVPIPDSYSAISAAVPVGKLKNSEKRSTMTFPVCGFF